MYSASGSGTGMPSGSGSGTGSGSNIKLNTKVKKNQKWEANFPGNSAASNIEKARFCAIFVVEKLYLLNTILSGSEPRTGTPDFSKYGSTTLNVPSLETGKS
jgi:hypothetical protein